MADEGGKREGLSREEVIDKWMKNVPLKRPASPAEFANLAVFLASQKASYITGLGIQIDGEFIKSLF